MKVLFTMTRAFDPYAAGVQRTTFKLGKYFTEQDMEVAYFSTKSSGNLLPEFGQLFHVPNPKQLENEENRNYLVAILAQFNPDIVINQMPYDLNLRSILFVRKSIENYILLGCLRNSLFNFLSNIPKKAEQMAVKKPFGFVNNRMGHFLLKQIHTFKHSRDLKKILDIHDYYILLAPQNLEELQFFVKEYKNNKTKVIPNSIPKINADSLQYKKKQILYVGSLNVDQKRADLLLPFWQKSEGALPDWEFIIVGDGAYRETMENFIQDHKLPRVSLKGHQAPEKYYMEASIFVMTSAYEGFPNTILEAHSYGCPIVAFRSYAAINWIVADELNALLSPPFQIQSLAENVEKLATDEKLLISMQKEALENAKRFTIDKVGQLWLDFFQEIQSKV